MPERQGSARRRWALAAASLALSGVAALGLGEAAVRILSPHGKTSPDLLRRETLQCEAVLFARHALPQMEQASVRTTPFRISRRGYRGPDFAVPKPPGVVRVVILGGSQVYDAFAPEGTDWPRRVETLLRSQGMPSVEVINAGTPGHASADSLGRFFSEVWMFEPDIAVICNAWNDIKYFRHLSPDHSLLRSQAPPPVTVWNGRRMVANPYIYYSGGLDRFLCHSQLYVRLRNRWWSFHLGKMGAEGLLTGRVASVGEGSAARADTYSPWGPRQYELNLRLFVAAARAAGAIPVLGTQPRLVDAGNGAVERSRIGYDYAGLSHAALARAFDECDRIVLSVAESERAAAVDLSRELAPMRDLDHFHDHVHTEPAGDEVIAARLSAFLAPLIRERSAAAAGTGAANTNGWR